MVCFTVLLQTSYIIISFILCVSGKQMEIKPVSDVCYFYVNLRSSSPPLKRLSLGCTILGFGDPDCDGRVVFGIVLFVFV